VKLSEKTDIFRKFTLKNRFLVCEIAWKNLNFPEIFLENRNFLTRVHDPQISNQIDAAVTTSIQTNRQANADRHLDRMLGHRQTDRQTNRQTNILRDIIREIQQGDYQEGSATQSRPRGSRGTLRMKTTSNDCTKYTKVGQSVLPWSLTLIIKQYYYPYCLSF